MNSEQLIHIRNAGREAIVSIDAEKYHTAILQLQDLLIYRYNCQFGDETL
jgi:hypothetical protein